MNVAIVRDCFRFGVLDPLEAQSRLLQKNPSLSPHPVRARAALELVHFVLQFLQNNTCHGPPSAGHPVEILRSRIPKKALAPFLSTSVKTSPGWPALGGP